MTTISAKIIADSISPEKIRLTTFQLRYPRFIHAELMTHRVFSRNASSSRAVPVEKTIKWILEDTAMPMHWGANQKGMQADKECNERVCVYHGVDTNDYDTREGAWLYARDNAIRSAQAFHAAGYHKQIVNRLLEPFSHINVLVTSTYWGNWYALRDHHMAMPEIQLLAKAMRKEHDISTPQELEPGQWHLPYIVMEDWNNHPESHLIKASVARCARTSYLTMDGLQPEMEADLQLYDRLVGSEPLHASPAEHQATPDERFWGKPEIWCHQHEHGNFFGWRQNRKMLPGEFVNEYVDPVAEADRLPWGMVA